MNLEQRRAEAETRVAEARRAAGVAVLSDRKPKYDAIAMAELELAAIVEATRKYVFVDRTGMKVLERSRITLALEFERGVVRALDDTLLFDRNPRLAFEQATQIL